MAVSKKNYKSGRRLTRSFTKKDESFWLKYNAVEQDDRYLKKYNSEEINMKKELSYKFIGGDYDQESDVHDNSMESQIAEANVIEHQRLRDRVLKNFNKYEAKLEEEFIKKIKIAYIAAQLFGQQSDPKTRKIIQRALKRLIKECTNGNFIKKFITGIILMINANKYIKAVHKMRKCYANRDKFRRVYDDYIEQGEMISLDKNGRVIEPNFAKTRWQILKLNVYKLLYRLFLKQTLQENPESIIHFEDIDVYTPQTPETISKNTSEIDANSTNSALCSDQTSETGSEDTDDNLIRELGVDVKLQKTQQSLEVNNKDTSKIDANSTHIVDNLAKNDSGIDKIIDAVMEYEDSRRKYKRSFKKPFFQDEITFFGADYDNRGVSTSTDDLPKAGVEYDAHKINLKQNENCSLSYYENYIKARDTCLDVMAHYAIAPELSKAALRYNDGDLSEVATSFSKEILRYNDGDLPKEMATSTDDLPNASMEDISVDLK